MGGVGLSNQVGPFFAHSLTKFIVAKHDPSWPSQGTHGAAFHTRVLQEKPRNADTHPRHEEKKAKKERLEQSCCQQGGAST